jgi:spermidine/putrescine transport system permease protein
MAGRQGTYDRRNRWLWIGLAAPGAIWLIVLFVVPFYVMLSVAGGGVNAFFQTAVPVWNPLHWSSANLTTVWHDFVGPGSYLGPVAVRTVVYTAIATAISLAIAYPVAYFVSRYAGKRKTLFLVLLIAPFWVSYMMRMLAWIDLLQQNGMFNTAMSSIGLPGNTDWLGGKSVTVIMGLVYGYIPYLILVLYAFLDRIDQSLIEAARDLGLSKWRTFWHVTVPLSKPAIIAGTFITVLPMVGDYYTNQLLSGAPGTTMIGNAIEGQLNSPGETGQGAVLSLMLLAALLIPMAYYVVSTARASREAA